jgi:hypothetical protein
MFINRLAAKGPDRWRSCGGHNFYLHSVQAQAVAEARQALTHRQQQLRTAVDEAYAAFKGAFFKRSVAAGLPGADQSRL